MTASYSAPAPPPAAKPSSCSASILGEFSAAEKGSARLDAAPRPAKDGAMERIYDAPHLARNPANSAALTPLGFLARSAAIYPEKLAVVHGERCFTYRQFEARCRRFADALKKRGIRPGDTVAVIAPNVPALLEAHYAVPMAG